ncbi:hypothetical protein [Nitrosomonas sp.]|uniref:hypothetical protein n=1 Tax=Nitrosomonas sp. TaxID=42353 RepID=UPI0032EEFA78
MELIIALKFWLKTLKLGRNATEFALNPETIRVSIPCRVLYPQRIASFDRAYFAPAHGFLAAFAGIFNKIATHVRSSRFSTAIPYGQSQALIPTTS